MRRDFTVNAMAMDRSGRLYDEFGGLSDIERKRLRTVGMQESVFRKMRCAYSALAGLSLSSTSWLTARW